MKLRASGKRTEFPRRGDRLFTSASDWWNNARLGGAVDEMFLYADGYKKAADIIVKHVGRTRSSQDFLVYPIVFLYRHHVELELKMIIRDGRALLKLSDEDRSHHRLGKLWKEARAIIQTVWPKDSRSDLDAAEELIAELEAADPYSTAFRYDRDRDGKRSIPKNISHINLRHLAEIAGRLSVLLEGVNWSLAHYLDTEREMRDWDS